jgi:hypothetical protein
MSSRREAIRTIVTATSLAATASAQQPPQHQHADPPSSQPGTKPLVDIKAPRQPKFFSKAEFETVSALAELIIPRTDTPGAKDVGAPYLMDERVPRDQARRKMWRDGLADLDKLARTKHGGNFAALPQDKQVEILTVLSKEKDTKGRRFFEMVKGATIDSYYETREGLTQELGWHGNQALTEFKGCTHPEHQA